MGTKRTTYHFLQVRCERNNRILVVLPGQKAGQTQLNCNISINYKGAAMKRLVKESAPDAVLFTTTLKNRIKDYHIDDLYDINDVRDIHLSDVHDKYQKYLITLKN